MVESWGAESIGYWAQETLGVCTLETAVVNAIACWQELLVVESLEEPDMALEASRAADVYIALARLIPWSTDPLRDRTAFCIDRCSADMGLRLVKAWEQCRRRATTTVGQYSREAALIACQYVADRDIDPQWLVDRAMEGKLARTSRANDAEPAHHVADDDSELASRPIPFLACDFLNDASAALEQRASTRDCAEGERSMARAVAAFNALSGHDICERDGWLFMAVLKAARAMAGGHNGDDYVDGAAYFALAGECAAQRASADAERDGV